MTDIKNKFEVKSFIITPETIDKFQLMENRRQISEHHVGKIHGAILSGKNPLGVLIVNELNNSWRLIDGNHRIEAVKRFYSRENNRKTNLECVVRIFKGLSPEKEREVYSDEAKRKDESYEDRLNLYKDTITFWRLTQDKLNKFPCNVTIYQQKNGLRFRTILDCLSTVKSEQKTGYVPRYLGKENIVEFARELKYEDLILMSKFIDIFQQTFGLIDKNNIFTRRQGFLPLFDIFYKNFKNDRKEEVIKRFSLIVGKSDIIMYLNMQGREAQQKIRELMVGYINRGKQFSKNSVI
jgi:hypothetical protein